MGVFRQLGDPLAAGVCLCEHHAQAYAEFETIASGSPMNLKYDMFQIDDTILQVPITITETCCIVVNAATMTSQSWLPTNLEIERPLGTIRTMQEDTVISDAVGLLHHAAWEVLPPGTYTYFLVNRHAAGMAVFGAWIKAIASDCEG